MRNDGLDEAKVGIKIAGRNIIKFRLLGEISVTSDIQMTPPF